MATITGRPVMTTEEFSAVSGLSRSTVYTLLKTAQIQHTKLGRKILIPVTEVNRVLGLTGAKDAAA